jgi:hypothetical protein
LISFNDFLPKFLVGEHFTLSTLDEIANGSDVLRSLDNCKSALRAQVRQQNDRAGRYAAKGGRSILA